MAERFFEIVLGAQRVGAAYLTRFIIRRFKKGPAFEDISFLSTQQTYQDLFTRNLVFAFLNLGIAFTFGSSGYLQIACIALWFVVQFGTNVYRWIANFGVYLSARLEEEDGVTVPSHQAFEFDGIEKYEHTMMLDQTGFRCLLLKSAKNESDIVRCELFSISITTPPIYDALSYHWGPRSPPGEEKYILCGHEKILVSDNCMSALLHLRRRHSDRLLWIDAICIDQTNTQEASQQVQIMGKIYQNAAQVIVWLGPSTPESRLAFRYLALLLQLTRLPTFMRARSTKRLYDKIRKRKHGHVIVQLSHRSWFSRVWTVQEVALAKIGCCSIVCGKDTADFDHLNGNLWIAAAELNIRQEYPLNDMLYHQSTNIFRFQLRSAVLFKDKPRNRTFAALMRYLTVFGATDPKDKVFSLYGILEQLGFKMPKPNYEDTLDEIYWKSTASIIRHEPSLSFLSLASGIVTHIPNAPSWVPDFRKMNTFMSMDGSVHATKTSPPILTIKNRDYELHVSGHIIDTIRDYSKRHVWEPEFGSTEVRDGRYFGLYNPEECLPTIHTLQEWTTMGIVVGSRVTEKYGNVYETMMSTVTQGHLGLLAAGGKDYSNFFTVLCSTQPMWDMAEDAEVFFEAARNDPQMRARFFDDPVWRSYVENPYWLTMCAMKVDDKIARVLHLVWAIARGNTVFETETGWFGLASHTLKEGDVVALISGMNLPAVLRPVLGTGERKFMFVGTAYVHGMMQGEQWDDERKMEKLVLV
ncbi:hypothetical protein VTL71DRAFT_5735 [Oculimacula yallundae]|uniref:Heterokaryon incompatibility domain-containing protein n=1 Tax=Oculimacula yallundae TaxID=86028 RepID=A0ABR4C0W6_9HELO